MGTNRTEEGVGWSDTRTCVQRPLPDDKLAEARRRALAENPANEPPRELELAVRTGSRWRPGRRLRIRFLDGDPALWTRVEQVARRWEEHAYIDFDFGEHDDAEIRVSFSDKGPWSFVGTEARDAEPGEPTMSLGGLRQDSPEGDCSRMVLHEFGHALGCVHEHQSPEAGIRWNKKRTYQYYQDIYDWRREDVDRYIIDRYSRSSTNSSEYDADSIMLYPIPAMLIDGPCGTGWNRTLSEMDKRFISEMYPR